MDVWHKFYTGMYLLWDAIDGKTRTEEEAGHKPLYVSKQCFTKIKLIMTTEEKDILIKDLSARLPYGVKCNVSGIYNKLTLKGIKYNKAVFAALDVYIDDVKPYLFPLSSMTNVQSKIFKNLIRTPYCIPEFVDWLNVHHFDFRGLLKKGLAIDATGLNIY